MGKKMGISSATEAESVEYASLFNDHGEDVDLESNMDNVQVKKNKGGGIAGNLARSRLRRRKILGWLSFDADRHDIASQGLRPDEALEATEATRAVRTAVIAEMGQKHWLCAIG